MKVIHTNPGPQAIQFSFWEQRGNLGLGDLENSPSESDVGSSNGVRSFRDSCGLQTGF